MRQQTFGTSNAAGAATGTAATAAHSFTTLPAQTIDAIAFHLPYPAMAGGRPLPAGNYTISALKGGGGESPILRFQNESGESYSVLVTRDDLAFDRIALSSEVTLAPGPSNVPRVERVVIEGNSFQFLLPETSLSN